MSSRLRIDQIPLKYHGQIAKQLHGSAFYLEREASNTIAKQIVRNESVAEAERKTYYSGKVLVRITSYRRRLLDKDNLCGKYLMQRAIPALSATINQKTLITKSRNVRSKAKTMKKRKLSLSP